MNTQNYFRWQALKDLYNLADTVFYDGPDGLGLNPRTCKLGLYVPSAKKMAELICDSSGRQRIDFVLRNGQVMRGALLVCQTEDDEKAESLLMAIDRLGVAATLAYVVISDRMSENEGEACIVVENPNLPWATAIEREKQVARLAIKGELSVASAIAFEVDKPDSGEQIEQAISAAQAPEESSMTRLLVIPEDVIALLAGNEISPELRTLLEAKKGCEGQFELRVPDDLTESLAYELFFLIAKIHQPEAFADKPVTRIYFEPKDLTVLMQDPKISPQLLEWLKKSALTMYADPFILEVAEEKIPLPLAQELAYRLKLMHPERPFEPYTISVDPRHIEAMLQMNEISPVLRNWLQSNAHMFMNKKAPVEIDIPREMPDAWAQELTATIQKLPKLKQRTYYSRQG